MKNLIIVLLITLASTASAQLNSTYAAFEAGLGKPVKVLRSPTTPAIFVYNSDGLVVKVCYVHGKAAAVTYTRKDGKAIEAVMLKKIFTGNVPNGKWHARDGALWTRDGVHFANMIGNSVTIMNFKIMDRYKKSKE